MTPVKLNNVEINVPTSKVCILSHLTHSLLILLSNIDSLLTIPECSWQTSLFIKRTSNLKAPVHNQCRRTQIQYPRGCP